MKLSVISPTYNELENVGPLIAELERILAGTDYEVLISDDDSPDQTWARVEEIGRRNPRVRVLRRTSNRGLGPSVVDGFNAASGEAVACIDVEPSGSHQIYARRWHRKLGHNPPLRLLGLHETGAVAPGS